MTDHSSLLKEKNNSDIVERLEDYAEDDYYFDHEGSLVTTNRPIALREASAEITRLRAEVEALRKDAARWRFTNENWFRFTNENWFQFFEPTQHWKVTTATGKVLYEGLARTYEAAVDAAIAATTESETKEQQA